MLFDTHAHYDDSRFDADRDELLASMPANRIEYIVNPGCDVPSSRKAIAYAQKYPFVYAAVGIHPSDITDDWRTDCDTLQTLAQSEPKVRAIGEIGLDYHWVREERGRARQQVAFRHQMECARTLQLPVIIHDREAHKDSLEISQAFPDVPGVYHCFSGSVEMARELLKIGYYLSFTGVITFSNARKQLDVIRETPLNRIMIETDAPYLTPEPYRGQRNSSLYVHRVAETVAAVKEIPLSEVEQATTENGKRFFRIS